MSNGHPILDQLSSEYRIVQDKIDKIGGFRFTIRGWTVTLITGAILAVASTKFLSPYSPFFLWVLLFIFAKIEHKQNRIQDILEDRAFQIEVEVRRLLQTQVQSSSIFTPRIAHFLRDNSVQHGGRLKRFLADPDRWFYWILAVVVLAAGLLLVFVAPAREVSSGVANIPLAEQREPKNPIKKATPAHGQEQTK